VPVSTGRPSSVTGPLSFIKPGSAAVPCSRTATGRRFGAVDDTVGSRSREVLRARDLRQLKWQKAGPRMRARTDILMGEDPPRGAWCCLHRRHKSMAVCPADGLAGSS
jgi:hypothetical protein